MGCEFIGDRWVVRETQNKHKGANYTVSFPASSFQKPSTKHDLNADIAEYEDDDVMMELPH